MTLFRSYLIITCIMARLSALPDAVLILKNEWTDCPKFSGVLE